MAHARTTIVRLGLAAVLAASMLFGMVGCIQATSEDEEILEDAGTSSGSAIVLDPDEMEESSSASSQDS